jgi:lipid II:glycine glycyltransferase (peptidoglycan interpeptide bridge formation enzyme)
MKRDSKMKISLVSGENESLWNEYIQKNEKSSFFHTLEWRNIVHQVYGFHPIYIMAITDDGSVKGVSPSFYTKSVLFGKKISSTPFNFYNGPIFDDETAGRMLIEWLIAKGKELDAKYVELKFMNEIPENVAHACNLVKRDHYFISGLAILENYEENYEKHHRKNMRTLRRKAEKEDVSVRELSKLSELKEFYDIMVVLLRNKHHMIPQPYALFRSLYETLHPKGMIKIFLALKGKKIIGGMVVLLFKDAAVYAYGASRSDYKVYSPSSLLVDNAIHFCATHGYKSLDFGVTSPHQPELLEFKGGWGCTHKKLPFYYYLISEKHVPDLDYHTAFKNVRRFYRYVPKRMIKTFSPMITKQLG